MIFSFMEIAETIQCPFCGQAFEILVDVDLPRQKFITDCEICCRPMEISVGCENGEILNLDVSGN